MEQLSEIIDNLKTKTLRDQYALYEIYKSAVSPQLIRITKDIFYKNKTLFIETTDQVWASQLLFYKKQIMENMKKEKIDIKDIKILSGYEPPPKEHPKNHSCKRCGSKLISPENKYCSLCLFESNEGKRARVYAILKETPWLHYEDLDEKDKKRVTYSEFTQEKAFQIQRFYDTINQCYRECQRDKQAGLLQVLKEKVEEYVILKVGIQPEQVNETIIQQHVSTAIFKQYQLTD